MGVHKGDFPVYYGDFPEALFTHAYSSRGDVAFVCDVGKVVLASARSIRNIFAYIS